MQSDVLAGDLKPDRHARQKSLDNNVLVLTDDGVAVLKELPKLNSLTLKECQIDQQQLARLAQLDRIRSLYLSSATITKQALEPLLKMQHLNYLSLPQTGL